MNFGLKRFDYLNIAFVFIFLVLQSIESLENCPSFLLFLLPWVGLRLEGTFPLFFSFQVLLQRLPFLFYFLGEVLLLLKELFEGARSGFSGSFGLEGAFGIGSSFLLLFKFPYFAVFVCQPLTDLFPNVVLLLFQHLNSFFLFESLVLNESLEIEEDGILLGCDQSGSHNRSSHLRNRNHPNGFPHPLFIVVKLVKHYSYRFKL